MRSAAPPAEGRRQHRRPPPRGSPPSSRRASAACCRSLRSLGSSLPAESGSAHRTGRSAHARRQRIRCRSCMPRELACQQACLAAACLAAEALAVAAWISAAARQAPQDNRRSGRTECLGGILQDPLRHRRSRRRRLGRTGAPTIRRLSCQQGPSDRPPASPAAWGSNMARCGGPPSSRARDSSTCPSRACCKGCSNPRPCRCWGSSRADLW
mmetsp:Transcript_4877/g.12050  ORF Transcript_4877/g.12050 Transcript_4877/m.12050 type:complete len:212 (+) Transcript_4877:465-1100(+)